MASRLPVLLPRPLLAVMVMMGTGRPDRVRHMSLRVYVKVSDILISAVESHLIDSSLFSSGYFSGSYSINEFSMLRVSIMI